MTGMTSTPPHRADLAEPADPARALAALVAVLHRRTAQDRIVVRWQSPEREGRRGVAEFVLDDDPPFRVLVDRAAATLAVGTGDDPAADDPTTDPVPVEAVLGGVRLSSTGEPTFDVDSPAAAEQVRAVLATTSVDTALPVSRLVLSTGPLGACTGRAAPPARPVHELVAERAEASPHAPAIRFGDRELSYRQLDTRASRLAARLSGIGVRPGDVVAVLMRRSPELIIGLLAVLKSGGAYLALDVEDPVVRTSRLLDDSGARLVLVDPELRDQLPAGVSTVDPVADDGTAELNAELNEAVPVSPESLAYLSYTSGSTGEPKGVAVPHRAVSRLVREPDWLDIRADDVFLQLAPVAFDASTLEIWGPLANGATLAIYPAGPVELDRLSRTIAEAGVTVLWLTAGLFHRMVTARLAAFAGLRHVLAGGDVISPDQLRKLLAAHPHLTFTNGYGPTENTTFTTCWTSRTAGPGESVPIGGPISGTTVAVLDSVQRPVPVGVCGELYAAGAGLACGYLNLPAATAQRFVPDPFGTEPGARMYRTGDLVRWTAPGVLDFLGRIDNQVKVNGFRVEPSAIEAVLTRRPEVAEAVVVAQPDGAGGNRLLAYVVPADPHADDGELGTALRAALRAELPGHQVPWAVLVRTSLVLNHNGKIDRRALPATFRVPRNVWNDFVAPRTPVHRRLVELWGEVLGVEPIGIEDDFFDLGGHSLIAAELLASLQAEFGVDLPARTLYLQPTIAELADEF